MNGRFAHQRLWSDLGSRGPVGRRQSTSLIPADRHRLGSVRGAYLSFRAAPLSGGAPDLRGGFLSINHPTAPFVGALERDPKISLIGTLAMLVEAPGDFDMVQQGRIWALADVLASWSNVQEAVIGVTNVMLVFEQPPEDVGALGARSSNCGTVCPGATLTASASRFRSSTAVNTASTCRRLPPARDCQGGRS